jgi:hypothetical protein
MEAASLWAGVRFTARNGSPEALLTDAAGQGLHLYGIFSLPGGFYGHCAAWQYRRLAALARHRRVRLRVEKRKGLYFLLRPLLRRKGLWTGLVAFPPAAAPACAGQVRPAVGTAMLRNGRKSRRAGKKYRINAALVRRHRSKVPRGCRSGR